MSTAATVQPVIQEYRMDLSAQVVAQIVSHVNRHVQHRRLRRIDVRYPSSAAHFPIDKTRADIASLLNEHGLRSTQVSLRPHESKFDDARGEVLLRLHEDPAPPPWWQGLLNKLLALFKRGGGGSSSPIHPTEPADTAPAPGGFSTKEALNQLEDAARQSRVAMQDRLFAHATVKAHVIARHPLLDQALRGLMSGNGPDAIHFLEGSLNRKVGRTTPEPLQVVQVSYRYQPPVDRSHPGTYEPDSPELEVLLELISATNPESLLGTLMPAPVPPTPTATVRPVGTAETLMPGYVAPRWVVRVLGTDLREPGKVPVSVTFPSPLVLTLPASNYQLDRQALSQAGLAQLAPQVLSAVSQSCPINLRPNAQGGLSVGVSQRTGSDGQLRDLYFSYPDGRPLQTTELSPTPGQRLLLWINNPIGASLPGANGSATLVPALRVEIGLA